MAAGDVYCRRPWFRKMVSGIEVITDRVRQLIYREPEEALRNTTILLPAVLELICSLIIFSEDVRYHRLNNESIENLDFPLSKWSRTVITRVKIRGDDMVIVSPFSQNLIF
jgi:hypothetical protein